MGQVRASGQWAGVVPSSAVWRDMQPQPHVFTVRAPLRCDGIGRFDCASHIATGERLAVRWLPLEANGEAAIRACEKLPEHPRLPRIVQTGTTEAFAFVAMEFPEGQLLSATIGERISLDAVLRLAADLSGALARMHDEMLVHGELSSESVLLAAGVASLWDVPLVLSNRLTDRRGESRLVNNLKRVAPYLAPERLRGAGTSKAADVYGLAAVICVAAGAPLPQAETTLGIVHQVSTRAWVPRVPSIVPTRWADVLTRMLAEEPSQRPSAHEVALAFADVPQAPLPTVPELQAVRLPAELLATAEAMSKRQLDSVASALANAAAQTAVTTTKEIPLSNLLATTDEAKRSRDLPSLSGALPLVPPASGPLEVTTAEVVRLPTGELAALAPAEVALTPTISVASELAAEGAHEVAPAVGFPGLSKTVLVALTVMSAAIVVLAIMAFRLAVKAPVAQNAPVLASQQQVVPAVKTAGPAGADLELAPVPVKRKRAGPADVKPAEDARGGAVRADE
jgi:serine/threonine protein kinase